MTPFFSSVDPEEVFSDLDMVQEFGQNIVAVMN